MQDRLAPAKSRTPQDRAAEIVARCTDCGLCNAVCPTYALDRDERDGPRGRVQLAARLFASGGVAQTVQRHLDRCLGCQACTTACPAGVDYTSLIELCRERLETGGQRPAAQRMLRARLARLLPHPERLRRALRWLRLGQPLRGLVERLGLDEVRSMIGLVEGASGRAATFQGPGIAVTRGVRKHRVILLAGCTQQVLRPDVNDATIRLLGRRGVDVEVAAGAGCCGAISRDLGRRGDAEAQARANIDAWWRAMQREPVSAILTTSAACGGAVGDYARLLAGDPAYAERAQEIAGKAVDLVAFLARTDLGPPVRWSSLKIANHVSCLARHALKSGEVPRTLLVNAGFTVVDIPEPDMCCGGREGYNLLERDVARRLRVRKIETIEGLRPDIVATDSIGCLAQMAPHGRSPIVHLIELIDWAHGGPPPRGLERYAAFVHDVPVPVSIV